MPVRVTKLPTTFFMFTKVPSTYLDQWLALSINFPREYTCSLTIPASSEFIQILNVGRHWICMSTIGCCTGTMQVFDSLYNRPNDVLIDHGCRMPLSPQDAVTFFNVKVQKQIGGSDCGLFALAFATDLCFGLDPHNQK